MAGLCGLRKRSLHSVVIAYAAKLHAKTLYTAAPMLTGPTVLYYTGPNPSDILRVHEIIEKSMKSWMREIKLALI